MLFSLLTVLLLAPISLASFTMRGYETKELAANPSMRLQWRAYNCDYEGVREALAAGGTVDGYRYPGIGHTLKLALEGTFKPCDGHFISFLLDAGGHPDLDTTLFASKRRPELKKLVLNAYLNQNHPAETLLKAAEAALTTRCDDTLFNAFIGYVPKERIPFERFHDLLIETAAYSDGLCSSRHYFSCTSRNRAGIDRCKAIGRHLLRLQSG